MSSAFRKDNKKPSSVVAIESSKPNLLMTKFLTLAIWQHLTNNYHYEVVELIIPRYHKADCSSSKETCHQHLYSKVLYHIQCLTSILLPIVLLLFWCQWWTECHPYTNKERETWRKILHYLEAQPRGRSVAEKQWSGCWHWCQPRRAPIDWNPYPVFHLCAQGCIGLRTWVHDKRGWMDWVTDVQVQNQNPKLLFLIFLKVPTLWKLG